MLRITKIVTLKTYIQKALILNCFFMLAQPPGERERTIVKFKKLLISKRRIGILENYLNKVKIVRVCDFNIFEIPILTVV